MKEFTPPFRLLYNCLSEKFTKILFPTAYCPLKPCNTAPYAGFLL